mmetsp:Transcript_30733/g.72700  ORF Transcript_30733/g.72700 Transcript_30733/m.72700 type:complete len:216 (+) Transcript_30733:287-934(+)
MGLFRRHGATRVLRPWGTSVRAASSGVVARQANATEDPRGGPRGQAERDRAGEPWRQRVRNRRARARVRGDAAEREPRARKPAAQSDEQDRQVVVAVRGGRAVGQARAAHERLHSGVLQDAVPQELHVRPPRRRRPGDCRHGQRGREQEDADLVQGARVSGAEPPVGAGGPREEHVGAGDVRGAAAEAADVQGEDDEDDDAGGGARRRLPQRAQP